MNIFTCLNCGKEFESPFSEPIVCWECYNEGHFSYCAYCDSIIPESDTYCCSDCQEADVYE